jgi:hypothetical protein
MASKYHLENSPIYVDGTDIPHNKQASNNPHKSKCALLEAANGLWRNRQIDGLVYQEQIRAEWNRSL